MRYFFRSLRYLRPYRGRIGVALLCTLGIAVLWGGGLGLVLPAAKILISDEGLHGWAHVSLASNRLGAKLVFRKTPAGAYMTGPGGEKIELDSAIDIISVDKDGPLSGKVSSADWIVGIGEQRLRDEALAKRLSDIPDGQEVPLLVLRQGTHQARTVPVAMRRAKAHYRALAWVARQIPDPGDQKSKRFPIFLGLLVVVVAVTLVRAALTFTQEYLVGTAIWRGIMDLRCENYNVVLHLPTTFFSEKGVSDATSRFIQDTNELARGQNTLLGKTMVEPAKALASLIVALMASPILTLMALVAGPPAFHFIRGFGKKMHKASKRALESWSAMLGVLNETLLGVRVVKAYTMEGTERRRFFRVNRQLLKQLMRKERLDAATGPTVEVLGMVAGMAAAATAGYLVFVGFSWHGLRTQMDRDEFLTWMVALFALFDPVRKLAKVTMRFNESDAAAKRIFDLQDTPQERFVAGAPSLPRHSVSLEFCNVSYRYPSASSDAVRNVTLAVRAGQNVAIVGPNGSGKTTLLSLLPRLLDPTAGKILIDGRDISQCSVRSLRRQIGLVTQDTVLFHGTIAENISYGLNRAKPQRVMEAAKKAYVDEFVRELPEGFDTMLGEHGARLSGGQRQRIAIARAILRDPTILIFDEAMSQVDADSERKIHQAMAEFVRGRTALMIAHRFATVLTADLLVVMNAGEVIDTGTHEELLKRCQLYHHLYRTQFVDSGGDGNVG